MSVAFVARVFGPSLPQAGIFRAPAIRPFIVNARRTRKAIEEPIEDALTPAADIGPASSKRIRKPRAAEVTEEELTTAPETETSDPASRSRRRTTVDEDETTNTSEELADAKPKRTPRKKRSEAVVEPDGTTTESNKAIAALVDGSESAADSVEPKRSSRKKTSTVAIDDVGEGGDDGGAEATPKPRAKRSTKKPKEQVFPDVVSTRGRRRAAAESDDDAVPPSVVVAEEEVPLPTASTVATKRRAATRRGGSARQTAGSSTLSDLSQIVIQRSDAGEVVAINRAALGMGRKMWYAVGVTGGMERKWAEQLRQKLANNDSTMLDPETGEMVPISELIVPWVPVRRDWVMAKKTGNVMQRDVVHKEGWVYVNAPLDERVVRIVEECYGFQQWRGEQDHFLEDVGSVKLITPLSEEAVAEIRAWEAASVEEQMDPATKEALSRQMFGEAGGDVLGRSERLEDREGETELDENGRVVYRNPNFTGGRSNPSNWYTGANPAAAGSGTDAADATGEAEMVSQDSRGNELAYAPEPEPKNRDRRQEGQRESRGLGRDRPQGQGQGRGYGQRQGSWQDSGVGARVREGGPGRATSSPPWKQQQQPQFPERQTFPARAGVRPSAAPVTPRPSPPPATSRAPKADLVLKFDDEVDEAPVPTPARGSAAAAPSAAKAPAVDSPLEDVRQPWVLRSDDLDDYDDPDEEGDAVGRIEGPSGGLDMDGWFGSRGVADGGGTATSRAAGQRPATAAGARSGTTRDRGKSNFGKYPALDENDVDPSGEEFDRLDGAYLGQDEFGTFSKDDFADFDFDLMDGEGGLGAGAARRGVGGAASGASSRRQQQQPGGRARSGGSRSGAAAPLDDDLYGGLSFDYMNFDEENDGSASTSRGGGGGYMGDFGGLGDNDMWDDFGSGGRRGRGAARGGSYGAVAGGKLSKGSGLDADDDLFGGGDDDWGYLNGDDAGGFGDFGDADPFDLDADPWGGGGGFGRQSRGGGGGRTGGYQSSSRSGGGSGGGYMSGAGPNYDGDLPEPVAAPAPNADRLNQGQGQGYRNGGGGGGAWKQGGGRRNSWQQGGSGYSNRGYQSGNGGYQSGGGGRGGGRGDGGGRRGYGGAGGYGQQQNRRNGPGGGREGGWQERRGGEQGGAQGAPATP
ncbi:hypothetical protein VaNZ11_003237 [Volvox africanus]|uniref:Uncharacterized protein n=1 Tax=Volvox africanus TaxID=51714 RepID=A0ABQ5RTV4_9CHLO|nr:hypothetical protein VaNZ11_003237 [Volvox africanus]